MQHLRRASSAVTRSNKLYPLRNFSRLLKPPSSPPSNSLPPMLPEPSGTFHLSARIVQTTPLFASRSFCSRPSDVADGAEAHAAIDYRSLLQENEFHELADSTIHHLLEKLEEYGDSVDIDGFDIDYGNEVLTMRLGDLGTYVVNKQTPNRQIWLSSPVSGPSRFDWDCSSQAWVYRRNKATLFGVLESELEKLCGDSVSLS